MGWNVNECPFGSDTDCEGQLGGFDARLLVRQHADTLSWPDWEALRVVGAGN